MAVNAQEPWQKEQRRYLKRHVTEITRIYSDMLNGEGECGDYSKIFSSTDFAYRKVRVERPLRLSFSMRQEGYQALRLAKPFLKLPEMEQEAMLTCLTTYLSSTDVWMDREAFLIDLNKAARASGLRLTSPIKKAIVTAFGERNETAEFAETLEVA